MIEVGPLDWGQAMQNQMGVVANMHLSTEALEEVECCTLVELLDRVLEDPEDDGLGAGKDQGGQVGDEHHQPGGGQIKCFDFVTSLSTLSVCLRCPAKQAKLPLLKGGCGAK